MKKLLVFSSMVAMLGLASCTDLTENVYGVIPKENFGKTADQLASLLAPVYANLRGYAWHMHNAEVTTDVGLVPTRGQDWYDGGNWLNYNRHTWSTTHGPIKDMWGFLYDGIGFVAFKKKIDKTLVFGEFNFRGTLSAGCCH